MALDSQQAHPRLVIAPLGVIVSVAATLVLAGLGGWLLATAAGPVRMSIGIAVLWVGLNVLIVGLVSSTAWRRRTIVVGGERVDPAAVAEHRTGPGRGHGVVLRTPEGGVRTLHGFTALTAPAAQGLARALNRLLGGAVADTPGADDEPATSAFPGQAPADEPVLDVVAPGRAAPAPVLGSPGVGSADDEGPGEGDVEAPTVYLRRGLPLVESEPRAVSDLSGEDGPAPDDTILLPRRARRE